MIELDIGAVASVTTLRFAGVQTAEIIRTALAEIAMATRGRASIRLLCDWSDVSGWACDAKSLPLHELVAVAGRVERGAILHDPRWNRQAALLGAVLRVGRAEVRSWHLADGDRAANWLVGPANRPV